MTKEIINENELTDMFGEGGKEEVKEFYGEPTPDQENKYDAWKETHDSIYNKPLKPPK